MLTGIVAKKWKQPICSWKGENLWLYYDTFCRSSKKWSDLREKVYIISYDVKFNSEDVECGKSLFLISTLSNSDLTLHKTKMLNSCSLVNIISFVFIPRLYLFSLFYLVFPFFFFTLYFLRLTRVMFDSTRTPWMSYSFPAIRKVLGTKST